MNGFSRAMVWALLVMPAMAGGQTGPATVPAPGPGAGAAAVTGATTGAGAGAGAGAVAASQPAFLLAPIQQLAGADDPEMQAQLAAIVEFQGALARWALDLRKLPAERRQAALQWATEARAQGPLAAAYAADPARRVVAAHALAGLKDAEASLLLARLIADPDRQVHLAAMEGVWDKTPTAEITDALWNRAVDAGLSMMRNGMVGARVTVRFRGRVLPEVNNYYGDLQVLDIEAATETLEHVKPADLGARLVVFYKRLGREADLQSFGNGQFDSFAAVSRLTEGAEPREVVPALYNLATGGVNNSSNGGTWYWTSRLSYLATLVKITGQEPGEYNLRRTPEFNNNWVTGSEKEEAEAVKKLRGWWKAHKESYLSPTTTTAPGTRPGG